MKQSNKILLATLVVLIIITVITTASITNSGKSIINGERITEEFTFEDFTKMNIKGEYQIELKIGTTSKITITDYQELLKKTPPKVSNNTLFIGKAYSPKRRKSGVIEITTKKINSIEITESSDLFGEGLNGEELKINLTGGSNMELSGEGYTNLDLDVTGSNRVDLLALPTNNAKINGTGSTKIKLNMVGGKLEASMSGAGSVEYTGEVSNTNSQMTGSASIKYIGESQ